MSGQQPGPVPETTPGGTPAPVAAPATTEHANAPFAHAPFENAAYDAGQPAPAAAPGWGAPPKAGRAPRGCARRRRRAGVRRVPAPPRPSRGP